MSECLTLQNRYANYTVLAGNLDPSATPEPEVSSLPSTVCDVLLGTSGVEPFDQEACETAGYGSESYRCEVGGTCIAGVFSFEDTVTSSDSGNAAGTIVAGVVISAVIICIIAAIVMSDKSHPHYHETDALFH